MVRIDSPHIRPFGRRRPIGKADGWCDDPRSQVYNRRIALPSRLSHEILRRPDFKYDVVGVFDWNVRPRKIGAGSAIFFHFCDDRYGATAGCVAIRPDDWRKLVSRIGPKTRFII